LLACTTRQEARVNTKILLVSNGGPNHVAIETLQLVIFFHPWLQAHEKYWSTAVALCSSHGALHGQASESRLGAWHRECMMMILTIFTQFYKFS
jgi:hypothetical protein